MPHFKQQLELIENVDESGPKATEIEITTEPNQTININKRKKGKNTNYNNMLQKSIHNNKSKNKRLKHFNEKETHEEKINSSEDETRMNLTTHKGRTGEDPFWGTSNPNSKNQLSNISKNSNNQLISKIYQDNQENQTDTNKNSEDTNIDNTISSEITDDLMSDNETIEDNTSSMDTNQEETDQNLVIIQLDLFNKLIGNGEGFIELIRIGRKNIKVESTVTKGQIPPATLYMLECNDTYFFKSFTNYKNGIKPEHQKEFEKIFFNSTNVYKNTHERTKLTKKEKDNVFKMIKIKLGWAYFNQIEWKNINHSDIIRKLQYIAGFVGKKQNFEYNKINLALREILKEELPDLPSHPNLIDKSIKVKIPYELPLIYHHLANQTKRALSNYFNIKTNKLPDSYIKVLPILPNDPGELSVEWKRIFPIKKYSMLKELRNVREKLRVEYFFSGKLPDTYFNFPKPRELLPFSPKGLPNYLAQYLPFNSNRTEKTLREIVQELREYYIFKKLPNNYFTPKPRLPNSPDNTIFNYIFPITEQNTANEFIKEARRKYEIIFPINKKWINVPKTNTKNKPFLPKNINELDAQFIVDEEIILPITNKTNIRNIVIKLGKKYFFERIPDEWISIEKTNDNIDTPALEISNIERKQLPDLTTTIQELDKYNIKITIPIIDDKKIHQTTQTLKKIYIFKYLPDTFINLPPIPNP
ncbi:9992_t:CDS:2, partial [Entrophospora sp. SA101]